MPIGNFVRNEVSSSEGRCTISLNSGSNESETEQDRLRNRNNCWIELEPYLAKPYSKDTLIYKKKTEMRDPLRKGRLLV